MQTKLMPFLNRELCVTPNKSPDGMAVSTATTSAKSTCARFHARMSETKRQKLLGAARPTSNPSFLDAVSNQSAPTQSST